MYMMSPNKRTREMIRQEERGTTTLLLSIYLQVPFFESSLYPFVRSFLGKKEKNNIRHRKKPMTRRRYQGILHWHALLLGMMSAHNVVQGWVPTTTTTTGSRLSRQRHGSAVTTTTTATNQQSHGRTRIPFHSVVEPFHYACSTRPRACSAATTTTWLAASSSSSSTEDNWNDLETDPFNILGLSSPTADAKEIKRAYKRRALQYHPDVVTNKDSTAEERRRAGERFAKINWAYETLSGKGNGKPFAGTGSSSTATSSSSSSSRSSSGWEPPHRRTGAYKSSNSSASSSTTGGPSTDWRDYIPNAGKYKVDDAQYDAGDDSFGKIFADLLAGAAAAGASGGGGIFRDFVEFLESNVDGVAGVDASDADLRLLLSTGTLDEIADEMDGQRSPPSRIR